ncbi:MAG: ATP-binding protein [Bacteroidales bacterium]|nr:ATP-binding protein [Candidatus Scybalocola fimicaballi]
MFKRNIIRQLSQWKDKKDRKPLILSGARQIGKTWVLKEFGKEYFDEVAYFSLDKDSSICQLFQTTKDPKRLLPQLSLLCGSEIKPQTTLVILDEIQECPDALQSLKYFCEETPQYAVVCAGSLLGVYLNHENQSFPVGKVDHLSMYPLTFSEYLELYDTKLYAYYQQIDKAEPIAQIFFDKLKEAYLSYCICGGMPEVSMCMIDNNDIASVESKLGKILNDYSRDFIKHTKPVLANRIDQIWQSLPSQLARENRKFVYQLVRPGARAREYEDALTWLHRAGLIYKVNALTKPSLPLKAYDDLSAFKIYSLDMGILRRLAEMDASLYYNNSPVFSEFKGALAENAVLHSLVTQFGKSLRYWSSEYKAEVDFLIVVDNEIIPIEVKADTNVSGKSIIQYEKEFHPKLRIRYSMLNLKLDGNMLNIPLFLADKTKNFIEDVKSLW